MFTLLMIPEVIAQACLAETFGVEALSATLVDFFTYQLMRIRGAKSFTLSIFWPWRGERGAMPKWMHP